MFLTAMGCRTASRTPPQPASCSRSSRSTEYPDSTFFTRTFPWIIDNIGGDITVDYYMQGSGRYTVPQMCALRQLRSNAFLQAQYLKCEAEEENSSEHCLCETGIDPHRFRLCVASEGALAGDATAKFAQRGVDVTPMVELGPKNTVFMVEDTWYLKKICTIFGDNRPRGCTKPFACNGTTALNPKKALAHFDKTCSNYCMPSKHETTYEYDYETTPYYEA